MANPFLVLGGIAVGIITASFGILQVPGWVASAQDASAINDLRMISEAQAASASLKGEYAGELASLQDGSLGLSFTVPTDRVKHFAADADGWCSIAASDSGRFFGVTETQTKAISASTLDAAIAAACGEAVTTPPAAPEPPATAEPTPTTDVITYTVRSDTDITFTPMLTYAAGTFTWSDGVVQEASGTAAAPARPLTANTDYTVTFKGDYFGFSTTADTTAARAAIRSMDKWFTTEGVASGNYAFYKMPNLTDVPAQVPALTGAASMFQGAVQINDPDISAWDVSGATSMLRTFQGARAFNQDLSSWDTARVKDLSYTFDGASAFNMPLAAWDTSNAVYMTGTFQYATSFNQDISGWNTAKASWMRSMFRSATSFNQDISRWNTAAATDMTFMFYSARAFGQDLSGWNVDQVTSYSSFGTESLMTAEQQPKF